MLNQTRTALFPPIDPYKTGMLDVGDGHTLYWEKVGTPGARPVVVLHGGPGGSATPELRRLFDPARFDVLLFDQRGCGRSKHVARLEANTTQHLVADIERLRQQTDHAEQWMVFGGSWGSLLGLIYAQTFPASVDALVLRGIFTSTPAELEWFYGNGVSNVFPDKWERFVGPVPTQERGDLLSAYAKLLCHSDLAVQYAAANAWCEFEDEISVMHHYGHRDQGLSSPERQIAVARFENHYFRNQCFLRAGQAVEDIWKIENIPAAIIHGRYDMVCPLKFAWDIHIAWPKANFQLIEMAGHSFKGPGMLEAVMAAIDRFAGPRKPMT